jgi:hypothetical protein
MLHASVLSNPHGSKGIKNGNFSSWPGLNEHSVEKYLSKSTSIAKGHLNQQRQNARSTKSKDAQLLESDTDLDHGIKTQHVYAATIDAGKYTQIKQADFPLFQAKGTNTSWYYMIMIVMQSWQSQSKIAQHLNY